eukprot:Platyproteum_vivax@DN4033_c0_g1_i1.p1
MSVTPLSTLGFPTSMGSMKDSYQPSSQKSAKSGGPPPNNAFGGEDLQLLELIGQGGNGEVYRGLAPDSRGRSQIVAVKIVPSKAFSSTKSKERTFCNAMSTLLSVDHPNVLRLDSIYNSAGKAALVSELCEGLDVVKLIQLHDPGTVNVKLCVKVFRDLLVGLAFLHDHRVVHCDVKLDNLKFRRAGSQCSKQNKGALGVLECLNDLLQDDAVILDLDSCLMEKDVATVHEESNRIARGTFQYMPPESFRGLYSYSGDMFSAAVTLYCLLDGHFPFRIRSGMSVDELVCAVSTTPKFKTHIWSRLPGAEDTVRALLNVRPERRPTAKEVLQVPWLVKATQHMLNVSPTPTAKSQTLKPPLVITVPTENNKVPIQVLSTPTGATTPMVSPNRRKNVTFDLPENVPVPSTPTVQHDGSTSTSVGSMSPVRPIFAVPAATEISQASPKKKPQLPPKSPKSTRRGLGALSLLYRLTRGRLGSASEEENKKCQAGLLPALLKPFGVTNNETTEGSASEDEDGALSPFSRSWGGSPNRGHARAFSK